MYQFHSFLKQSGNIEIKFQYVLSTCTFIIGPQCHFGESNSRYNILSYTLMNTPYHMKNILCDVIITFVFRFQCIFLLCDVAFCPMHIFSLFRIVAWRHHFIPWLLFVFLCNAHVSHYPVSIFSSSFLHRCSSVAHAIKWVCIRQANEGVVSVSIWFYSFCTLSHHFNLTNAFKANLT